MAQDPTGAQLADLLAFINGGDPHIEALKAEVREMGRRAVLDLGVSVAEAAASCFGFG